MTIDLSKIEYSLPRPCMDHTSHCKRWIESSSENCSPKYRNAGKISINSYPFMREVCQKSCSEAVDNFRSNKCRKYVSNYLLDFCRVFFCSNCSTDGYKA